MFSPMQLVFKESRKELNILPPAPVAKLSSIVNGDVYDYICQFVDINSSTLKIMETSTRLNIDLIESDKVDQIINLKKSNEIRYVNKFFETINKKLRINGTFIGCVETYEERFRKIFDKYPYYMAWFVYTLDFIVRRIFPKFSLTRKIYFFLTKGRNRALSRVETLGRLISCGFKIIDYNEINNLLYFVVKKIREPYYPSMPSYGFLLKMRRIGKGGKTIYVYKLRTMHPYAEYLQEYVYNNNALKEGGKFNNDFRITSWGRLFRKLWIDELPMFLNYFKGELKLVGVRPLTSHYLSLYTPELKELRIKTKPGLLPPYYADMPETLGEIMASEEKYLSSYLKNPLLTDWRYFWKAVYNILIKRKRSS